MKSNMHLTALIEELKTSSIKHKSKIWKRIAVELEKPTQSRRIVNISKIEKFSKKNETVVVPGKVLGMGDLTKKITIAAYNFSKSAREKISSQGSKAITISELMKKKPKGSKIRIIG
ncbi:50S ribosomal protein L18e [Candidatus Woesearchaeota archaeon]|nr:50S ribosomal protein L18e [Candidatus Woesearchaeota archaeon]